MKTVICDFCGKKINDDDWRYGFNFRKTFKILWIRRDIPSCFDDDDVCESCFKKFLKLYDSFKCEVKNG